MDWPRQTGRPWASVSLRHNHPLNVRQFRRDIGQSAARRTNPRGSNQQSVDLHGRAVRTVAMARLEAALMLAGEPISSRKLAQFASLADGSEARTLVRGLNELYDSQGSAFRVEEVAGGFQLLTRARFSPWLRRLNPPPLESRMSSPAMETLAVVAYRQPVLRADIEAIRGVQSGEMLRQLMERDLVRIAGRSPELGRPFLYGTTRRFLQLFGLRHLDELPRCESYRTAEEIGPESTSSLELQRHAPAEVGDLNTVPSDHRDEEFAVKIASRREQPQEDSFQEISAGMLLDTPGTFVVAEDDDDDDFDDDEDDEDDDEDDDLDDDLDDEEWEEVDDDDEDLEDEDDEDWDEEEDWDDEDEDDDDDDWDDDEEDDDDEDV